VWYRRERDKREEYHGNTEVPKVSARVALYGWWGRGNKVKTGGEVRETVVVKKNRGRETGAEQGAGGRHAGGLELRKLRGQDYHFSRN